MALDVGEKRIGVALVNLIARIPSPYQTLSNDELIFDNLQQIIKKEMVVALCVGLPRGLEGQSTAQTRAIEAFVSELKKHIALPVYFQDEAVTSRQAEAELQARGKPYAKGEIDALAATYILEDFIHNHPEVVTP